MLLARAELEEEFLGRSERQQIRNHFTEDVIQAALNGTFR